MLYLLIFNQIQFREIYSEILFSGLLRRGAEYHRYGGDHGHLQGADTNHHETGQQPGNQVIFKLNIKINFVLFSVKGGCLPIVLKRTLFPNQIVLNKIRYVNKWLLESNRSGQFLTLM